MALHRLTNPAASPPALSDREIARSLRFNVAAGATGMIWMAAAIGFPLPLLMTAVHATGFQLGLLSAAWQAGLFAQLPSTLVVEHLRWRKPWWAFFSTGHRLLWLVPALLPWIFPERRDFWPWAIVAALSVSSFLGQAGAGPWQSWMSDLVPPRISGRFWGIRQGIFSVMVVVGALLHGAILDAYSDPRHGYRAFQLVFGIAGVCGVCDILIHLGVKEPAPHPHIPGDSVLERILTPLRNRDLRNITLAMGAWCGAQAMIGYTAGLPGYFAMGFVKESLGATFTQASWLFVAGGIGAAVGTPLAGHWIDRYGARRVLLGIMTLGPALLFSWSLGPHVFSTAPRPGGLMSPALLFLCALALPIGGVYASAVICQYRLIQAHTMPAGRSVAIGVHWSIVGVLAALGPLFSGAIKDHFAHGVALHFAGVALNYLDILVAAQAAVAWGIALPLVRRLRF